MTFQIIVMPDRIQTFQVRSDVGALIGYIRHTEDGKMVARTLGDRFNASDIRRFHSTDLAAKWLLREHPASRRAAA